MSGQQIGTAVGFVAGFFLPGGPQVWAGIGGMIGGAIDPTQIQGPRLSDGMSVTANDGIPNPWGFGTFAVGANVLNSFDLVEHKHTDDGKGSGTEQITYTYTRSFALGICRGKRNPDGTYSPIAGILRVTHNGKVVYNTQPDAEPSQLANNAKFLRNHRFYLGGDDQLPDPTLESYLGSGNASAYRGQVYMVATDEDQTDSRGSIGTWEFVVAMDGVATPVGDDGLQAGRLSEFIDSGWPLAEPESNYRLIGSRGPTSFSDEFEADSISEILEHFSTAYGVYRPVDKLIGYSAFLYSRTSGFPDGAFSGISEQPSVLNNTSVAIVYNERIPTQYIDVEGHALCPLLPNNSPYVSDRDGNVVAKMYAEGGNIGPYSSWNSCGESQFIVGTYPVVITATRKRMPPKSPRDGAVAIPDAPGFYLMPDGSLEAARTYSEVFGSYKVLSTLSAVSTVDDRFQYTYYERGPAVVSGSPDDNPSYWISAYEAAVLAGSLPAGWTLGVQYPANISSVYLPAPLSLTSLAVEGVPLATIVAEVCRRSGLDDGDFDVSQLTDLVGGFKVAVEATGESVISSLMPAFFFDCGEWDDNLRFVKRGASSVFSLTVDDLAERDGPVIEETEAQEVELLRKVMVRAMDPDAGYVETTQAAERRSSTVAAKGEQTLALPVVMAKDTQARVADKRIKVAWSENRRFKLALPYTRPDLTPTDVGTVTDRQGRTQRVRLMEMTEDSGLIQVEEAMLDRQSSYTSSVEGVAHAPPIDTSPGLIGPTFGVVMNLPSLRTQDNTPGAYIAACGYLPGWRACAVLMSVDGGESFAQVAVIAQSSRMGVLTDAVTSDGEPIRVFMNSGDISSITDTQMAARGNAWAITSNFDTPSAASEVGQSKTATQDSGGGYELTENIRGGLGTIAASHAIGDTFVMLSSASFLPLDISLSGQTLLFKFVSFGTSADDAEEIEFVFNPLFTSITIDAFRDENGVAYTDENGENYYSETIT